MKKILAALLIILSVALPLMAQTSNVRPTSNDFTLTDVNQPASEIVGLLRRFAIDRNSLNRYYSVPFSHVRRARYQQFYADWLALTQKLNFDALNQEDRVDYTLFTNHLRHELRELDIEAARFSEMEPLVPFAKTIIELEEARRRMDKLDAEKTARLLTDLNKQILDTRKSFESPAKPETKNPENNPQPSKIKKTVANRAFTMLGLWRNTLKNWFNFYNGYDPLFTWWVGEPYKQFDKSLEEYAAFVRDKLVGIKPDDKTTIIGDPIGRDALMSELVAEMIPYTPEELIALARKELDWCENEMKKAARELGYGDDWAKALEYVKTLHVEPGKQPELIRELALEAIEFLEKNDLVTIPQLARDTWRLEMLSPERQLVSPFFLGGEVIQVSFPTNSMTHEQKMMSMRGNNRHFSRATVHHELIPGHHLQGFMTSRYRTHRSIFGTPFWGEGWALYWELLLWDMNFAKTPENKIGMLFWRMHRCARIIFSLSFHLEQMTPQECIDLLVKRVGHEVDNATAEVRRSFAGDYSPLYQCAYLLGGLQFRALHRELVESGKMTNRAFHDAILRGGSIPVEMVRAGLTNQTLTRDFQSNWKFYGANPANR